GATSGMTDPKQSPMLSQCAGSLAAVAARPRAVAARPRRYVLTSRACDRLPPRPPPPVPLPASPYSAGDVWFAASVAARLHPPTAFSRGCLNHTFNLTACDRILR